MQLEFYLVTTGGYKTRLAQIRDIIEELENHEWTDHCERGGCYLCNALERAWLKLDLVEKEELLRSKKKMSFICFDTEDDSRELLEAGKSGFDKKVTQIAAITREGEHYYNRGNADAFLLWCERQEERYIYAHNLQYDIGNLFSTRLDQLNCTFVGGRLIRAEWKNKIFLDSFNIWPMAAKTLAPAFGLKKLETESMARDRRYVFRDVEIIHAAMSFAWQIGEALGLHYLPSTLGGMAIAVWRHWGGENCPDANVFVRQALHGGRVELWKQHNDCPDIAYCDINSLYPAVMRQDFPGPLEDCRKCLEFEHGIAECRVRQPETNVGVLPWADDEGRTLYPWGEFSGTWTLRELREFERRGGKVLGVKQCFGTNEKTWPYKTFAERLYLLRQKSRNDAEKLFFKLLMNTLWGRLGTSGKIGRTVNLTVKTESRGIRFGNKVLITYHAPVGEEVNWGHAAYVASYGRLELLRYIDAAGVANMIYCDTDSVIFDCPGKKLPFPIGKGLGEMKLEGWESSCETFAPKTYKIGKEYKAKGVPRRLARKFIRKGSVSFDLPFKFRESIAFYDRGNSKQLSVWREVTKKRVQTYDKKRLCGNRYFPLHIKQS